MKKYMYFLCFMIAFQSCNEAIDLEIDAHTPVLVLNSILTPDTFINVSVSNSIGAFDVGNSSAVRDARLELYEDDVYMGNATFVEQGSMHGYYVFNGVYPSTGKLYKIEAAHDDYETAYAICAMPEVIELNEVKVDTVDRYISETSNMYKLKVNFEFEDDPSVENYYWLQMYRDTMYYGKISRVYFSSNEAAFGNDFENLDADYSFWGGQVLFTDGLFNGQIKSIELDLRSWVSQDIVDDYNIILELSSLDKSYYQYKMSKQKENDSDGFFGGEPVQIYSNVQNGLGVFVGKTTDTYLIEID